MAYFYKLVGGGDWTNIDGVFEIGQWNGEYKVDVRCDLQEVKCICEVCFSDVWRAYRCVLIVAKSLPLCQIVT